MEFIHLTKSCINSAHITSVVWSDDGLACTVSLSSGSAIQCQGEDAEAVAKAIKHKEHKHAATTGKASHENKSDRS